ncbi:HNH endonuclease [Ectothiorhodospira sp. BSL-9]|uniref:HNH endonuclease n=1 Tax=Ectothiorhodospira sp. BSL-9 TaxID=1442136 RepID=UPI0012E8B8A8|nr:hypothetical protein [Ectothiorhodospira sp. BSL-9]
MDFRESILQMDGYACVKCNRSIPEVVLQVHHKRYEPGKPPWDYAPGLCETLCKGCHAREHGKIRPNEGWSLYDESDLGGLYGECECCGTSLRYIFYIQHPNWEPMAVGTNCCDNLTGTSVATNYRKMLGRRKRFINSKRWRCTPNGMLIQQGRFLEIEIRQKSGAYIIYINSVGGKKLFNSESSAKEHVFDIIESGDASKFACRHPLQKKD